ncbi:hypothetical protein GW933_03240 [Candidatus Falkowbacteria bacterium]|uniref:Uncharacterized protein n=1 Tax=Candidatus Buchananbacteria bacterium CG10_big_fil_rev_8_21_14_0_10_33_19 TaxID=1974525 RepID=A0A2H0W4P1_9BACT|nr:hypothetical protein [Candidatus Falkowbacteria bacterium]PIS06316.1 MAG: hypothetical protein COT80_01985 [Candidatus Buchananbacteria bacterium CG10_big_fil_rev_8_21_14_0_10_33_19]
MNFLTIEKFNSRTSNSIWRRVLLGLIVLVVPTIFVMAWLVLNNSEEINFTVALRQLSIDQINYNGSEITLVTRNN